MSTAETRILVRDDVAARIELERSARGEAEPIVTRIEDERDIEKLLTMLSTAQADLALSERQAATLRESLSGKTDSSS